MELRADAFWPIDDVRIQQAEICFANNSDLNNYKPIALHSIKINNHQYFL